MTQSSNYSGLFKANCKDSGPDPKATGIRGRISTNLEAADKSLSLPLLLYKHLGPAKQQRPDCPRPWQGDKIMPGI